MAEITSEQLHHPDHTHRLFLGDSVGCLRVTHAPSHPLPPNYTGPSVKTVVLPGFRSHSSHAVQRMAAGALGESTWVIAMARKSGTVDVVHVFEADASTSSAAGAGLQASILATITEDRMRAGIERWVGLAVAPSGIFSCTSAGSFRFTPISLGSSESSLGEPKLLDLPGPLQHCCFYPASNPTHFSYAGEEIPPSLWDISLALSEQPQSMAGDESIDSINTNDVSASPTNAKLRKRKRQAEARAKAKEYAWGEVWRAKNLPNDYLSLPQRANVAQVAIVDMDTESRNTVAVDCAVSDEAATVPARTTIVVGTKDGLIRVFEPASGSRKHSREHRIVQAGQGAIKTMGVGLSPGELFVADSTGKLYSVDWRNGQTQYHYKDITGAITSLQPLPAPVSSTTSEAIGHPLLFSASQDKLIRLHTTEPPPANPARTRDGGKPESKSKVRGETLWTAFSSGNIEAPLTIVTAVVWDGKIPTSLVVERPRRKQKREGQGFGNNIDDGEEESEVDDEEEEEVWGKMKEIGGTTKKDEAKSNGTVEDEDAEQTKDERRKRTRK
ncbi:hypothetical protein ACQY0O_005808 [Thecaphora frezii]